MFLSSSKMKNMRQESSPHTNTHHMGLYLELYHLQWFKLVLCMFHFLQSESDPILYCMAKKIYMLSVAETQHVTYTWATPWSIYIFMLLTVTQSQLPTERGKCKNVSKGLMNKMVWSNLLRLFHRGLSMLGPTCCSRSAHGHQHDFNHEISLGVLTRINVVN